MLFWTMKITIVSIILIFLVHHLLVFFKTNLTTPKIKDLVYAPAQKYDAIFNSIKNGSGSDGTSISSGNGSGTNILDLPLDESTTIDMKNELKQFMKKQFKENAPLQEYSSNTGASAYSNY